MKAVRGSKRFDAPSAAAATATTSSAEERTPRIFSGTESLPFFFLPRNIVEPVRNLRNKGPLLQNEEARKATPYYDDQNAVRRREASRRPRAKEVPEGNRLLTVSGIGRASAPASMPEWRHTTRSGQREARRKRRRHAAAPCGTYSSPHSQMHWFLSKYQLMRCRQLQPQQREVFCRVRGVHSRLCAQCVYKTAAMRCMLTVFCLVLWLWCSFTSLTPVWAGQNQVYMMARPCEFAGFNRYARTHTQTHTYTHTHHHTHTHTYTGQFPQSESELCVCMRRK